MELKPVIPFEPESSKMIPSGKEWTHQIKWDGTRILSYHSNNQTRLYNRHLRDKTGQYPELVMGSSYCEGTSFILDGEVIALGEDGNPSFYEVMKRDRLTKMDELKMKNVFISLQYNQESS